MSFTVSRYEATGTTPAKRAPLDIDRPITVENDEVLFENYKEPVFNDTLEPEEVTEEDIINESGPTSSRNSTLESENDENSGFDTSLAYEPRKSTAEAVPFFKVNIFDWNLSVWFFQIFQFYGIF